MAYTLLQHDEQGGLDARDSVDGGFPHNIALQLKSISARLALQAYSLVAVAVLCALLLANLFIWPQHRARPESSTELWLTYGRDFRYMSLDHQYDHLWQEWSSEMLAIKIYDKQTREHEVPATISM